MLSILESEVDAAIVVFSKVKPIFRFRSKNCHHGGYNIAHERRLSTCILAI